MTRPAVQSAAGRPSGSHSLGVGVIVTLHFDRRAGVQVQLSGELLLVPGVDALSGNLPFFERRCLGRQLR